MLQNVVIMLSVHAVRILLHTTASPALAGDSLTLFTLNEVPSIKSGMESVTHVAHTPVLVALLNRLDLVVHTTLVVAL